MIHKSVFLSYVFLISWCSSAQYSDRFQKLAKELQKVESRIDTLYYPNGSIWSIESYTIYAHDHRNVSYLSGRNIQYYRNGQVLNDILFDTYGIALTWSTYYRDGTKSSESSTYEIDTSAKDLKEFLETDGHINIKKNVIEYRCDNNTKTLYIYKKGVTYNGKKFGLWLTYHEDGTVKREKIY